MKRANNQVKIISRYVLLVTLAALVGINVYALNASRLAGNQVPMPFGVGASVVLSGSMEPELSVGDLLLLREQESYTEGDIIVYQSGAMPVVHRILSLRGETVITKGDANNVADEPFHCDAIKGKVVLAIPWLGYAVWALKTPMGILLTLAAAVILVELSYRECKTKDDEEKEKIKAEIRQLMKELEQNKKD